jgi:hypothetical protein
MNREEAKSVLSNELKKYRTRSYDDLRRHIGTQNDFTVIAPSGAEYQIEVDFFWDSRTDGTVRVMGVVDDGGPSALHPLSGLFIVAPSGEFVGE